MSSPRGSSESSGSAPLHVTRPMRRVARAGARNFAATFTLGGGIIFCLFLIGFFSRTPMTHLAMLFGIVCAPVAVLALVRQVPRVQLWWRRARPRGGRCLTVWQRRRRFWPRKKGLPPEADVAPEPQPQPVPPEPDPDSCFVPTPPRDA